MKFEELDIIEPILKALKKEEYSSPQPDPFPGHGHE